MVTKVKEEFPKTKDVVEKAMKIASREMDSVPELKVQVLNYLLYVREILDGKQNSD